MNFPPDNPTPDNPAPGMNSSDMQSVGATADAMGSAPTLDMQSIGAVVAVATPQAEAGIPPEAPSFAQVLTELSDLRDLFQTKIAYDTTKDALIAQLSDESRSLREAISFQTLKPHVLQLIALYDDIGKMVESHAVSDEAGKAVKLEKALTVYRDALHQILSEWGVDSYTATSPTFDGARQTQRQTAPTQDPALVGTVSRSLRPGFEYWVPGANGRTLIVRPEWVEVYVLGPSDKLL